MLDQSRLYAQVLALRQQLRERVPQVERVVTSLRKWAASHEPESPSRKVAERALAVAALHLAKGRAALEFAERARQAFEDRAAVDADEDFATDWIVRHGIARGMPRNWNTRVR